MRVQAGDVITRQALHASKSPIVPHPAKPGHSICHFGNQILIGTVDTRQNLFVITAQFVGKIATTLQPN